MSVHIPAHCQQHLTATIQSDRILANKQWPLHHTYGVQEERTVHVYQILHRTQSESQNLQDCHFRGGHEIYASSWVVALLRRWKHIHGKWHSFWTSFISEAAEEPGISFLPCWPVSTKCLCMRRVVVVHAIAADSGAEEAPLVLFSELL